MRQDGSRSPRPVFSVYSYSAPGSGPEASLHRAADGVGHEAGDDVRVDVGVGATIFEVALLVDSDLPGDADRGATVGHAVAELVVALGLVRSGQTVLDAGAVVGDVQGSLLAERLAAGFDVLVAAVLAHLLGGEVGVGAGAVPVALGGLGIECRRDAVVLADPVEEPASDPELVGDFEQPERADLELPLSWHHFGIDAGDRESSCEAGLEMILDEGASVDLVLADAAVVAALWLRVPGGREAVGPPVLHQGEFLLDTEHRLVLLVLPGGLDRGGPCVGRMRLAVDEHDLAHDEHVVATADGVGVGGDGLEHAVTLVAGEI